MSNLIIGIICMALSLFLYFYSPNNISLLGYKSPQLGTHKNIWKWSNKCFGVLAMIGSGIYLITSIIFNIINMSEYDSIMNKFAIAYVIVSIFMTELYSFIRVRKNRLN